MTEKWRTNLLIGNSEINFMIDTGADVTVIPEEVFRQCNLGKLHSTFKRLFGADHNGLRVMGTVRDTLSLGETCVTEDVYVIKGLKEPLLYWLESIISKVKVSKKGLKRNTLNCSMDWENLRENMKSS